MSIDTVKLETLKQRMLQDADIVEVFRYFADHFGDDPDFIEQSLPAHPTQLQQVILEVGTRLLGIEEPVTMRHYMVMRVPDRPFYHGGCILGDHLVTILYWDDIRTGCLAATAFLEEPTQFARFTMSPPSPQGDPPRD